jgi:spore coat protein U-like protein
MKRSLGRLQQYASLVASAAGLLATAPAHAAADTATLTVSAAVLSKSTCKFSGPGGFTLDFGTINPSSLGTITATATRVFSCGGSSPNATFALTADSGLYSPGAGVRRMRHQTNVTEFISYSLSLSPATGTVPKNTAQTLTVTGTMLPADFQNGIAGSYSDTVLVTLTP